MLDELSKLDGVISIEYDKMFRRVELVFDLRKKRRSPTRDYKPSWNTRA